jgi:hypothetical protein
MQSRTTARLATSVLASMLAASAAWAQVAPATVDPPVARPGSGTNPSLAIVVQYWAGPQISKAANLPDAPAGHFYLKRSIDKSNKTITDEVYIVRPAQHTESFTIECAVTTLKEQSGEATVRDSGGQFSGTGALTGAPWEWRERVYTCKYTNDVGYVIREAISPGGGISIDRVLRAPNGQEASKFVANLRPVSAREWESSVKAAKERDSQIVDPE